MQATVFVMTIRERWRGMSIGAATLAVFFLFGMAVYKDIDLGFYNDLPEAVRTMMNIPEGADVGSLAYGAIYGLYGALVMGILAVMVGATLIAGEERNGTLGQHCVPGGDESHWCWHRLDEWSRHDELVNLRVGPGR